MTVFEQNLGTAQKENEELMTLKIRSGRKTISSKFDGKQTIYRDNVYEDENVEDSLISYQQ